MDRVLYNYLSENWVSGFGFLKRNVKNNPKISSHFKPSSPLIEMRIDLDLDIHIRQNKHLYYYLEDHALSSVEF